VHFANFNELLAENARVRPGHKAVTFEGETWTYGELETTSRAIAAALYRAGIRKGDRVAVMLPNQPMFLGALFGAARIGAVPVLVNVFYGTDEILGILRHSQSKLLFVEPVVRGAKLQGAVEEARKKGDLPDLETLWTVEGGALSAGTPAPDAPDASREIRGSDLALMIYTSGTTGSSKGVMLTYEGLLENARVTAGLMKYSDEDTLLPALPLFSSAGVSLTLISMIAGTHIVLIERNNPQIILETIERERVTILDMVPSGLKLLMKFNRTAGHDTSSLRLVVVGGDSSPPDVGRAVLDDLKCNFAVVYGLTETSPVVSITHLDATEEQRVATVGPPIDGMECSIRDESGRALPAGEIGEVCCKGLYVMPGYFRNEEGTRQCIDDAGWFHTGDLGTIREDGHLVISGRKKDMVIVGGHNVFPAEVESHLIKHPAIKEVAVVGMEHPALGNYLVAFVLLKTPGLSAGDVQAFCNGLAQFKVPQRVLFPETFPYTGSGKVNKRELRRILETQ